VGKTEMGKSKDEPQFKDGLQTNSVAKSTQEQNEKGERRWKRLQGDGGWGGGKAACGNRNNRGVAENEGKTKSSKKKKNNGRGGKGGKREICLW